MSIRAWSIAANHGASRKLLAWANSGRMEFAPFVADFRSVE